MAFNHMAMNSAHNNVRITRDNISTNGLLMSLFTSLAIYFIIWWITLFAVLPWGVTSQHEAGSVADGTDPSAPVRPFLLKKVIATTIASLVIFSVVYWIIVHSGLRIEDIPILGKI